MQPRSGSLPAGLFLACIRHRRSSMDALTPSDFADFAARSAAAGQILAPAIVLIAGVQYPAVVPTPRLDNSLLAGGEVATGQLIARILLSDCPTAPAENQRLDWKRPSDPGWHPVPWFINTVSKSPLDVEWHLACVPLN